MARGAGWQSLEEESLSSLLSPRAWDIAGKVQSLIIFKAQQNSLNGFADSNLKTCLDNGFWGAPAGAMGSCVLQACAACHRGGPSAMLLNKLLAHGISKSLNTRMGFLKSFSFAVRM